MGYDLEVEMIRKASELGMSLRPTCSMTRRDQDGASRRGYSGGACRLNDKGAIGAKTALTLDESVKVGRIHDAGKSVNPDVIVLCHGGPISEPEDAAMCEPHEGGSRIFRRFQHRETADRSGDCQSGQGIQSRQDGLNERQNTLPESAFPVKMIV